MKTSNKLLIAFASALILIPVLGIAIISRVYYEKGDSTSHGNTEMDTFGAIPKNMSAIAVNSPFQSVSIDGGNQLYLAIKLVEDENAGVKYADNIKGLISAKVDGNGQLQIVLKKSDTQPENYARIWIYGPHIKQLSVANGRGINLNAKLDSLQLDLSSTSSAHFDPETQIGWLSVRTKDVREISFRETNTKSVSLDLIGTNVKSEMSSFENLSISAAGNAEIELNGGYGETTDKAIKHLTLNTLGKAKVKIFNMQIDQCSGRFSDSTQVEMPAVNINQMYNSKK
ncbi:MAG TPA: DUF2807 domain-containing protein [Pedobacter sp.]|uniref:GIN domain-containing protein n=1 Tax=Pedobacter sp. TaxID=1411316 RepID=UPI002D00F80F|nr:DUF2807 domain-containing protein [Pedobacter sp.]HMI01179.1 DUF2807 domain-containing protein [Pedobacter sp.]